MTTLWCLLFVAISGYYAWRYSKITIDPDWAMFNLAGFTGSWYGRDFLDCKSPAIHIWYWLIAKCVGRNVKRVRFVHHFIVGIAALPIYLVSDNQWVAFAYLVLVQSGWLIAFHGNVGQQPAAFVTLALVVHDPYVAVVLWWIALAFEPKLILSFIAWLAIGAMLDQALITVVLGGVFALAMIMLRKWEPVQWLVEANIVIPKRMREARKKVWRYYLDLPSLSITHLYIIPWLLFATVAEPTLAMWLPAVLYVALIWYGLAVRSGHYIPVIPWIAVNLGSVPMIVITLVLVDWISSQFYLGDIWKRFYLGIRDINRDAKQVGIYLHDRAGTIYVNDIHTGIYIYAEKPVQYKMAAQIEIREVAKERRETMLQLWKDKPADWVVDGPMPLFDFSGKGYLIAARAGSYTIWKLKVRNGSL